MRIQTEGGMAPAAAAGARPPDRQPPDGGPAAASATFLLLLPLVVGLLGAPASPPGVRGDELSDAKARQAQLKKEVADQKAAGRRAQRAPGRPDRRDQEHGRELRGINADLDRGPQPRSTTMETKIDVDQGRLRRARRAGQRASTPSSSSSRRAEVAKKARARRAQGAALAERVRSAYDTDRTSLLETFLSGGTFTDLLAEMSYYIDVGEQDKALANQIANDQETLAVAPPDDRGHADRTNELRQETAAQKRALDESLLDLKDAKAELEKLEKRTAATLAAQKRTLRSAGQRTRPPPRRSSARPPPSRSGWPRRSTS